MCLWNNKEVALLPAPASRWGCPHNDCDSWHDAPLLLLCKASGVYDLDPRANLSVVSWSTAYCEELSYFQGKSSDEPATADATCSPPDICERLSGDDAQMWSLSSRRRGGSSWEPIAMPPILSSFKLMNNLKQTKTMNN